MDKPNFTEIINDYKNVISTWKKRVDVMNGYDLSWKATKTSEPLPENNPRVFGSGTGTTGWCVSASQSLLEDIVFQELLRYRNAQAKLVSIDIKEQYYGYCYNGSQNKWHTAILVYDSGVLFIIDVTVRQFGNNFVGKDIWDFVTWQDTFRSSRCKHKITDFVDNEIHYRPQLKEYNVFNREFLYAEVFNNLHSNIGLDNEKRGLIADFLVNNIVSINNKLINHSLSVADYEYLEKVNDALKLLDVSQYQKTYSVFEFANVNAAKNWLKGFLSNNNKTDMYVMTFNGIKDACLVQNIDMNELNQTYSDEGKFFVVFEFFNQVGYDLKNIFKLSELLIPFDTNLEFFSLVNGSKKFEFDRLISLGLNNANKINSKLDKFEVKNKFNTSWIIIKNQ